MTGQKCVQKPGVTIVLQFLYHKIHASFAPHFQLAVRVCFSCPSALLLSEESRREVDVIGGSLVASQPLHQLIKALSLWQNPADELMPHFDLCFLVWRTGVAVVYPCPLEPFPARLCLRKKQTAAYGG